MREKGCAAGSTVSPRAAWTPTPAIRLSIGFHAVLLAALAIWPGEWRWLLAGFLANHLLLACVGMWPRSTLLGPNLVRLPACRHRSRFVALTFDDGPTPQVTLRVLDLLDQHGAKASFFCVGRCAARHPELVREIIRRGHSVENHTDRHPIGFACYSLGALRREIERAQATLTAAAGHPPQFFRAPFGLRSPLLDPVLAWLPLRYVSWTRRGYDRVRRNSAAVLRGITHGLAPGDIILLHDTADLSTIGHPVVLEVLPRLLQHIEAMGLQAVSLPVVLNTPAAG